TKFMSSMVDLGAILDLPDDATRAEWDAAGSAYKKMSADMAAQFGADISEKIDLYFSLKGSDKANTYLANHPEVSQALDWKSARVINSPLLSAYYGGFSTIENYYNGVMYSALDQEYPGFWDTYDAYQEMKLSDPKGAKKFYKAHPELKKYWELKDQYSAVIARETAAAAALLQDPQGAAIRPDASANLSIGQQDALSAIQNPTPTPDRYTWQDWQGLMTPALSSLVQDYVYAGKALPSAAETKLDKIASDLGIDTELMLTLITQSLGQ
ncbi:MAG TPA: hypothetical protein VF498_14740, partial [Anaerolineales bacterium]